jgi:uncharacterized membrane protein YdbT with pleckstrin-like domain
MASYDALHLDQDEHVILEVRKHWIVFVGHAMSLLFGAVVPFVVLILIARFAPHVFDSLVIPGNVPALFLFFYSLWLLFLWITFFLDWTKYFLNVWYVTEKRIIDVDQKRLFDREITNLRFDKIQDVTLDVHGFLQTMLNFGSVKVQTAAENSGDFFMTMVQNPDEVRRVIFNQHNEIGDRPLGRRMSQVGVKNK